MSNIILTLFALLCGTVVLLSLIGLLWGLLVAAADTREVPDGNEEYL